MSGRRSPMSLPRWIAALLLGTLLLAAQQLALLHPLSHLHDEAPASEAADLGCGLCLAGAAASPLATAATATLPAAPRCTFALAGAAPCRWVAQAPSTGHNRGPPTGA